MAKTMIDPPSGWKYGFPKVIPKEHQNRTLEWLVENGYPQEEIDSCRTHRHNRFIQHLVRRQGIKLTLYNGDCVTTTGEQVLSEQFYLSR